MSSLDTNTRKGAAMIHEMYPEQQAFLEDQQ